MFVSLFCLFIGEFLVVSVITIVICRRPPDPRTLLVMTSLRGWSTDPYLPEECVNLVKRELRRLEPTESAGGRREGSESQTGESETMMEEGAEKQILEDGMRSFIVIIMFGLLSSF